MSIILKQLTQILAKVKISSSHEEEILIAAKDVITPLEANKEESTFEKSCISDEEHLFELDIEEDEKGSRVIIMQMKAASNTGSK